MKTINLRQCGHLLAQAAGLVLVIILVCGVSRGQTPWSTPDPSNNINNTNSGNVGIGTATPAAKLDVAGTTQTQSLNLNSGGYSGSVNWGNHSYANWYMAGSGFGSSIRFKTWDGSSYSDKVTFQNDGNVGIGTAGPANKLQVSLGAANNAVAASFGNDTRTDAIRLTIDSSSNGLMQLRQGSSGTVAALVNSAGDSYFNGGNVGIGTTSPAARLSIFGGTSNINIGGNYGSGYNGIWLNGSTAATHYNLLSRASDGHLVLNRPSGSAIVFNENDATTNLVISSGGNVGIGTTNPTGRLSIFGGTSNINMGGNYGSGYNGIWLNGSTATTHDNLLSRASDGHLVINRPSGSAIIFNENDATTNLVIASGGNVGIATSGSPTEKLEVNGNIKLTGTGNITLSGTINAKYQDVAEWVLSSEQLAAGTVVVLDSTKSNQVIASTVGYDTRVAGVISARPGIALGEQGEGKVLVATTGRVKIKVEASKSPIQIGDLLVTSDVPGVAMKSEAVNLGGVQIHRPGTLIGKALEPLAKGKGEILVLLSLQ